jgi:hypothetical protein
MNARQAKILELLRDAKDHIETGLIMDPQNQVKTVINQSDADSISPQDSETAYQLALEEVRTAIDMLATEFPVNPSL